MVKSIKRVEIYGFKNTQKTDVEFNDKINIIVDNESGKSSLLEAIDVAV